MGISLEKISAYEYRLPRQGAMRVDGLVFVSPEMMEGIREDPCLQQVQNVATLPGIVGASLGMPDIHWGYGFPIGGVAAFDAEEGVVSPGGVGYDINCGVRLLRTGLSRSELKDKIRLLTDTLFTTIPTGVGSKRRGEVFSPKDYEGILEQGARWAVERGFGEEEDLSYIEEGGRLPQADPKGVSERAKQRGHGQLGTLGSGNHFVEVGYVDEVYDETAAATLGLVQGGITVIVHTGSRGLGHQVCSDHLETMLKASAKYSIDLPDRQLCCAPIASPEAKHYLGAMAAAANFAFANRQLVTHYVRQAFEQVLGGSYESLGIGVVYDICHNIAKFEEHPVKGRSRRLLVHRKGATRSFPPGHPLVPPAYGAVGQPVLIPGDMGRYSYVLVGTRKAQELTFGSTCHGAGRLMSRHRAKKTTRGRNVERELWEQGIYVHGASRATINEEVPWAYKDVADVVEAVEGAGLSKKVVRLRPLGVIKG
jgi:tRNA-splicing ligase RtcB